MAAAKGLGGFEGHKRQAASALVGALEPYHKARMPEVQVAILMALGALKEEESLPSIYRCFRRRGTAVAVAAVEAVEAIRNMVHFVEPLIKWTGEKWPGAGEWEIWWERHKRKGGCNRGKGG